ncbi:hypothetical protein [Roseibacillus ishigakijimensis]|uniref:TPM domain-containing protein n=1 Tax=Roseibacillus ishigakijimensis TaxID=454146 RepID=A0A934VNE9_9BACT|nr:hypothetical protein [Roseibacillus ishigakijimensis]MBK1834965.1 hypothetical protein [Roseibacillus ishigakijimensis]
MTKCPRCVQRIHRAAESCPHCGFVIAEVDQLFGGGQVRVAALCDAAGALRAKERKRMRLLMNDFENRFPQLFFAVYLGAFEEASHLRQFGFWLLNRGEFVDVEKTRSNAGGILLTLDVAGKSAGLSYGYGLQPFLKEKDTFAALSCGHPLFLQGQYLRGIEMVLQRLEAILVRQSKRAAKNPAAFQETSLEQATPLKPERGLSELLRLRRAATEVREP